MLFLSCFIFVVYRVVCNCGLSLIVMRRIILLVLLFCNVYCQESAQYLQNAVRDLRKLNYVQTLRRADTKMSQSPIKEQTIPTSADRRIQQSSGGIPPLSLTKGELLSLYENAIAKGDTLKLDAGDNTFVNAAVHELDEHEDHLPHKEPKKDGYYYYYYPIKSFIDEMTSQTSGSSHDYQSYKYTKPVHVYTTQKPPYTFHSHHHEHNVNIKKEIAEKKLENKLEPLFMAISGFVGMAVMFVISLVVLPKFGKPSKKIVWPKTVDMDELARLALNAIEGSDCRERFACELSKTARNFNMTENRFIKLLKRLAPGTFGKHIERFTNYGNRQLQCTLIPCIKRPPQKIQRPVKKTPVRKKHVAQNKM